MGLCETCCPLDCLIMKIHFMSLVGLGLLIQISSSGVIPGRRRRLRRQAQQTFQSDIYRPPSSGGDNTGMVWLAGGGGAGQGINTGPYFHGDPGHQNPYAPPQPPGQEQQWYQSDVYRPPQVGGENTGLNWLAGGDAGQLVHWPGSGQAAPLPIYIHQAKWQDQPAPQMSYDDRRALEQHLNEQKTKWEWDDIQRSHQGPHVQGGYDPSHVRPQDVQAPNGNGPIPNPYLIGPDGRPYIDPTFQAPPPGYYDGKIQPNPNNPQFPPYNSFNHDSQQQQWSDNQFPSDINTDTDERYDGPIYPDDYYVYYASHGESLRSRKKTLFILLFYICMQLI